MADSDSSPMTHTQEHAFLSQLTHLIEQEISPLAADWSMGSSPSAALYEQAAKTGLTSIEVPEKYNGLGLSFRTKVRAVSALAQCDFGFAMSLVNTHNVALRISTCAPDTIRENYLPKLLDGRISACTALTEPTVGSDVAAMKTTAKLTSSGWLINGEKSWIVNARHAGVAIVFAQCDKPGDSNGIGAFAVDLTANGVKRYAIDSAFSQTSIGTGGFTLSDVAVSNDNLLLLPGTAFKSILTEINGARAYVAAMCNAMLQTAIQQAQTYGDKRKSFGKVLSTYPSWTQAITQAESDLQKSIELTNAAVDQVDSTQDAQLAAINAKIDAVQICQRHLPELLHAMGAEGLLPQYCFTRHLAATQLAALTDGATNVLRERSVKLTRRDVS